jgi:molybdate transport system substrate-binding protein
MRFTIRRLATAPIAVAILLAACGDNSDGEARTEDRIVVFAASSLTEAFNELGAAFEEANPGSQVVFNFGGSGDLARQIIDGAPADVFAAADSKSMAAITEAGMDRTPPEVIARNTFEIIVEPGNPLGIATLSDLADPDLVVVLCAPSVPCGAGAAKVLAAAGVTLTPRSLEDKVKGVVTKVTTGEADAGIVFVTDVLAAGDTATGVAISANENEITSYPMVVVRDAPDALTAQAFVEFVTGDAGRAILAAHGFLAP